MQIVIDTSVVIAVLLSEPERERLLTLTTDTEIIVPKSLHWEVGNAFSAMFKRKRVTLREAQNAVAEYGNMKLRYEDISLSDALKIADKHNIYAYDAYFIVCAEKFRAPLLTIDKVLMETAKKCTIHVLEV